MKINVRLLLITFFIVVFVTVTSTLIYYSITISFLRNHFTNTLLTSARDFGLELESNILKIEDEFIEVIKKNDKVITSPNLDFIFEVDDDIILSAIYKKEVNDSLKNKYKSIARFVNENPNIFIYSSLDNSTNKKYYFGQFITEKFLNKLAEKTGIQNSFLVSGIPYVSSFNTINEPYYFNISSAWKKLKYKNNYDFVQIEEGSSDFWAAKYTIINTEKYNNNLSFIVYITSSERTEFAESLQLLLVIVLLTGIALSLILILLFTTKIRKQISYLSGASEQAASGNFDITIPVISQDELGKLSVVFNNMISELGKKEKQKKEYSEFLELINKNPELEEISEVALSKIINACNLSFGSLYIVENGRTRFISAHGIDQKIDNSNKKVINFYQEAIKSKKPNELIFTENYPTVKTGLLEIKIKYYLIVPIIYNDEVISIIELASKDIPKIDVKDFIDSIHNELAVGLINAKSLEQLENLVNELKVLNTEYKKQNEQIISQNTELLELHRAIKEKADELEQQKEKAEKLTKVKSQFLASMSHELRTPLNSILGLTELVINDEATTSKTAERLVVVLRNGNKLLTLINNILEFSKSDSEKISVKEKEFLLSDLIEELQTFLMPLIHEKDLFFEISQPTDFDYVLKTDKTKIDQIITNLLANAVKFTSKGFVKFSSIVIGDTDISFVVEDSGIGISEKNIEKIFEDFKQIDNSNSKQYGGTGLGLAICKRYVNLLNGNIKVESSINKGSTFTVSIPNVIIKKIARHIDVSQNNLLKEENHNQPDIIIVNDNEKIRRFIGDYLSSNGFSITYFNKCENCYDYLAKNSPSAIIISNMQNDLSSWETILGIKENYNYDGQIISTNFIINENLGYAFLIDHFYKFEFPLSEIKEKLSSNSRSILFVSPNNYTLNNIYEPLKANHYIVQSTQDVLEAFEVIQSNKIDSIVIQGGCSYHEELNLIARLRDNKATRNIIVHYILPEQISIDDAKIITEITNKIIRVSGYHNFDVLKVLRDRLVPTVSSSRKAIEQKKYEKDDATENDSSETVFDYTLDDASILIVDDDSDTLFTVGQIVEDLGYITYFAKNGVECLIHLNSEIPDIILLDIMMPQMDGFETIKRIRGNNDFENIPVLALTAHAMIDDKGIIEKNGFNGLITKPVNKAELAFKIQKVLENKRHR